MASANARSWLGWLLGLAALAAVVIVATHVSEPQEFARMVERAEPWWIGVALGLQAATYVALAQVWRATCATAQEPLPMRPAGVIALAKLFIDQTLPSGGISGSALLVGALERRGISRGTATSTVIVEQASYYFAYAGGLAVAVAIAVIEGRGGALVAVPSLVFIAVATGIGLALIAMARARHVPDVPGLRRFGRWLHATDRRLTGNRSLLATGTAWQLAVIALDGLTMWSLLRSVGAHPPIGGTFASFMLASLARSLSIMPAGLGVFEGVAVFELHQLAIPVTQALSATLLFRGVSYWLPMIPGFIASRRV